MRICIGLAIYNIFGQEVTKTTVNLQNRVVSLNVSNLSAGFYLAVCKYAKEKFLEGSLSL